MTRPMPGFLSSTLLLFRLQLASAFRSRRMLVCATLAIIPPALAFFVTQFGPDNEAPESFFAAISLWFSMQLVVPLVSLVAGSAVVTEEIENRTITYLFSRPISRSALLIGRWLASTVWVGLLLGASSCAVAVICAHAERATESPAFYLPTIGAVVAGGAVYTLVFAVLGVFLRRPMIVGLGYVFAFEGLVANLPGSNQKLALQFYLRSLGVDPGHGSWTDVGPPTIFSLDTPVQAVATLAVLVVLTVVVGSVGISRRQYVLSA